MFSDNLEQPRPRRLPMYLLVDTSSTMAGEKIEAVQQFSHFLYDSLLDDPQVVDMLWLSIITFGTVAEVILPLTKLIEVRVPTFSPAGATCLGKALERFIESIQRDLQETSNTQKGDYRPLVFILTDGKLTDNYDYALKKMQSSPHRPSEIIVFVVDNTEALNDLKLMFDRVLDIRDASVGLFTSLLAWNSSPISATTLKDKGFSFTDH